MSRDGLNLIQAWSWPLGMDGLRKGICPGPGFPGWKPTPELRAHSVEFKCQVAQGYLAGRPVVGESASRPDKSDRQLWPSAGAGVCRAANHKDRSRRLCYIGGLKKRDEGDMGATPYGQHH